MFIDFLKSLSFCFSILDPSFIVSIAGEYHSVSIFLKDFAPVIMRKFGFVHILISDPLCR